MNKKTIIFSVAVGLLIALALFVLPSIPEQASAQSETDIFTGNITGWMWSSNIGWIKLDSDSDIPVTMTYGQLNGFAWSPSVGWINFNPETTDYPSDPQNGVMVDITGEDPHAVTGWARACSVFTSDCSGELKTDDELGGWDGWIRMETTIYDTSTNVFSGYAWGGLNIGWARFNSPDDPSPPGGCVPGAPDCPPVTCTTCGGGGCVDEVDCPEVCTDDVDNDGDSFIDCEDTLDCSANPACITCASSGQPYGEEGQPIDCCLGEEDTDDPPDGICGDQTPTECTISSITRKSGSGPIRFDDTNPLDENGQCSVSSSRSGVASLITVASSDCSGENVALTFSGNIPSNAYFEVNGQNCSSGCEVSIDSPSSDLSINIVYTSCPNPRPASPTLYSPTITVDDSFSTNIVNLIRYTIPGGN